MLQIKFKGLNYPAASLSEAVATWELCRDTNGWGASDCAGADVYVGRNIVARISYNGRCWHPRTGDEISRNADVRFAAVTR